MNTNQNQLLLENLANVLKEESVKYEPENTIVIKSNNEERRISFDEFLESPNKYLKHIHINVYILLLNVIENGNLENIKKIINKKILGSEYYDFAIDAILNDKIKVPNDIYIDTIKLLYENISLPSREYFLGNCISHAKNEELTKFIIEILNNEPYLEISKILLHTTNMDKSIFYKLIEICSFDEIKNDLFMIMFQNLENAQIFIDVYKEKKGNIDFSDIPSDKITPLIISQIIIRENKELGELLFKHVKLDNKELYVWLMCCFMHSKFKALDFILEKSNINKIDENITYNCLSMCNNISLEVLEYLAKSEKFFGKLDFTFKDHHIMRQAIINNKIDIIKFLLKNNFYSECANFTENELLNETLEFFASEEIKSSIKKHYNIED